MTTRTRSPRRKRGPADPSATVQIRRQALQRKATYQRRTRGLAGYLLLLVAFALLVGSQTCDWRDHGPEKTSQTGR